MKLRKELILKKYFLILFIVIHSLAISQTGNVNNSDPELQLLRQIDFYKNYYKLSLFGIRKELHLSYERRFNLNFSGVSDLYLNYAGGDERNDYQQLSSGIRYYRNLQDRILMDKNKIHSCINAGYLETDFVIRSKPYDPKIFWYPRGNGNENGAYAGLHFKLGIQKQFKQFFYYDLFISTVLFERTQKSGTLEDYLSGNCLQINSLGLGVSIGLIYNK